MVHKEHSPELWPPSLPPTEKHGVGQWMLKKLTDYNSPIDEKQIELMKTVDYEAWTWEDLYGPARTLCRALAMKFYDPPWSVDHIWPFVACCSEYTGSSRFLLEEKLALRFEQNAWEQFEAEKEDLHHSMYIEAISGVALALRQTPVGQHIMDVTYFVPDEDKATIRKSGGEIKPSYLEESSMDDISPEDRVFAMIDAANDPQTSTPRAITLALKALRLFPAYWAAHRALALALHRDPLRAHLAARYIRRAAFLAPKEIGESDQFKAERALVGDVDPLGTLYWTDPVLHPQFFPKHDSETTTESKDVTVANKFKSIETILGHNGRNKLLSEQYEFFLRVQTSVQAKLSRKRKQGQTTVKGREYVHRNAPILPHMARFPLAKYLERVTSRPDHMGLIEDRMEVIDVHGRPLPWYFTGYIVSQPFYVDRTETDQGHFITFCVSDEQEPTLATTVEIYKKNFDIVSLLQHLTPYTKITILAPTTEVLHDGSRSIIVFDIDSQLYTQQVRESPCAVCGAAASLRCSLCKHVPYCGKTCQAHDWTVFRHKQVCPLYAKQIAEGIQSEALNKSTRKDYFGNPLPESS